ncbi:preprotein translocase subunit SecE [Oceaniserpentilla sp. 4NH20-0058]|uniref:preprotein translocase subunit SecE n=1 Tax=Oceaniserpentilla sp. 4NH20-0058 TaxID=3127660 RepID=UPI003108364E
MSGNTSTTKSPLDAFKWIVAVAIVVGAIVGNQVYAEVGLLYRILGVVALFAVAFSVAATTSQGRAFLVLLKEANIERRKVVWPTRQETVQTTMIVVAVVILVAIILWGLDSLLSWIVSSVIG